MTHRIERERHVSEMLSNFRLEGLEPDEDDWRLLQAYIEGAVNLDDLLAHARTYASYKSHSAE